MDEIFSYIQGHVEMAPYIIPSLMLLAGFNIPVPEDGMLFLAGVLAAQHPELTGQLFAGVFVGAYGADMICFGLARVLGPKLYQFKWFAKMVSKKKVAKISTFYDRFGFITLIVGRFIPFGVRNALFMTAGFSGMNTVKFAVADFVAAMVTCACYFWLYYTFGESVIDNIKHANIALFGLVAAVVLVVLIRRRLNQKETSKTS
jgi:membrane-associated protein